MENKVSCEDSVRPSITIDVDAEPIPIPAPCIQTSPKKVDHITPEIKTSRQIFTSSHLSLSTLVLPNTTPLSSGHVRTPSSSRLSSKMTPISEPSYHMGSFPNIELTYESKSNSSKTKRKSFSNIYNGITGYHISVKVIKIAAQFWKNNIINLSTNQKLEIGCSIYLGALATNTEMKSLMNNYTKCKKNKTVKHKQMGLKFVDMLEWLILGLEVDNIDLYTMLIRLGLVHQQMGVNINYYSSMLESIHETFSWYFPNQYTIEQKYAYDEIFTLCAQIMTGEDLKSAPLLNHIGKSFENENNIGFTRNLDTCLKSTIGRQYFYQYLKERFCDETVVFLQLLRKFKSQVGTMRLFMVAKDIVRTSIEPNAHLTINVSYECRNNTLDAMEQLQQRFIAKQPFHINSEFFAEAEQQIYRLIFQCHWTKFVKKIKTLHAKSF